MPPGSGGGIPYYVREEFAATHATDRNKLAAVERHVVRAHRDRLLGECIEQRRRKAILRRQALGETDPAARREKLAVADRYEASRCAELERLYPGTATAGF